MEINDVELESLRSTAIVVGGIGRLEQSDHIETIYAWLKDYICKTHPKLGRQGPICPFVPSALRDSKVRIVLDYNARSLHDVESVIRAGVDHFKCGSGQSVAERRDRQQLPDGTLIVAFPDLPILDYSMLDTLHPVIKAEVVHSGVMIGQFHPLCGEPAVRNGEFPVSRSPIPLMAIRSISEHDILFNSDDEGAFTAYRHYFGKAIESGLIRSAHLVDAYRDAEKRFIASAP